LEKGYAARDGREEKRTATPRVLAADLVELPRGAKLSARPSDIYIDRLNPVPIGSQVRI